MLATMKLIFYVAAAVLAGVTVVSVAASPVGPPAREGIGGDQAAVSGTINLGVELPMARVKEVVPIHNTSNFPIFVRQVLTSCGCVRAAMSRRKIPPRTAAWLTLAVETHFWPGPGLVTVMLEGSMDGKPWRRELRVAYRTRRLLRLYLGKKGVGSGRAFIDFGSFRAGTSSLPSLRLVRGGFPARWNRVECRVNSSLVFARLRKTAEDAWLLTLNRVRPGYVGSQSFMLRFSFRNHGRVLPYHLSKPVTFRVDSPVDLYPGSILFGVVRPGAVVKRKVSIWTGTAKGPHGYRIGLTLLAAAGLKACQYSESASVPQSAFRSPIPASVLVGLELFPGIWLISGALSAAARKVAIGCFSVFACYTFYQAASGQASCGCFGQVQVNPWYTVALDVAIALALMFLAKPAVKVPRKQQNLHFVSQDHPRCTYILWKPFFAERLSAIGPGRMACSQKVT